MPPPKRGFSLAITAIFLGIILAVMAVAVEATFMSNKAGRLLTSSLTAQQIAEAGLHKSLYCLNALSGTNCSGAYGLTFTGETNVAFGGGSFTTTVSGTGASRSITAVGTAPDGRTVTVAADATTLPPTDATQFSYALQAGAGGAYLENNASVSGTIFTTGDIICQSTNATISGDAYSARAGGLVSSCRVNNDAHADRILNSKVTNAYYRTDPTDIAGSTVSDTKYPGYPTPVPDPENPENLPSFDEDFWRASAAAGGTHTGDYSPSDNSHLGPIKIVGNLIMNNNVDVIVDGPVWVVGNITTGNNSSFTLNSAFGADGTTILADDESNPATSGRIDITNNTSIYGSGQPTSHILFVSTSTATSDAAPALSVANNATGAVFMATGGTLRLSNNAGAKSLAAYRLSLSQNTVVNYVESDFTGYFANSPGGTWHLTEGTWREVK